MKTFICIVMAVLLSNVPHVAAAEIAVRQMIPTSHFVDEMNRSEREARIIELLSRDELSSRLEKLGLSKAEISKRVATLSDAEFRNFENQLQHARFGADPITGILVIVVLVLLILFLAKRV